MSTRQHVYPIHHAQDGNLVHALIRRGHTKSLLQVILPNHPDVRLSVCLSVRSLAYLVLGWVELGWV